MSKFTTDELIDRICWKDDDRVLGPNDPYYPIGEDTKNAIIAKLRAADKLCEAWKKLGWMKTVYPHIDLSAVDKAIKEYDENPHA
jgi:UDP-galactopyranose mutase